MKMAIDANTVSADNQVTMSTSSYILGSEEGSVKIAVLGNSITRHGPKPTIGWTHDFGMAASDKDHDYVHLLFKKLTDSGKKVCFFVKQFAVWERNHEDEYDDFYTDVGQFNPDIIVFRLGENVNRQASLEVYEAATEKLLDYVGHGKAKLVLTTCFWKHGVADDAVRNICKKRGIEPTELNDLGELDEMKAIGLFEHSGVANHPGDLGMENIAERIYKDVMKLL
jgi:hypothetical protein